MRNMSEEFEEMKERLYETWKRTTNYIGEHPDCMSAAYPAYESDSIKIEVRIKRKV